MVQIGKRIDTSEGVFFELEDSGNGMVYKNEDVFRNHHDEVCYVPEAACMEYENWIVPATYKLCFTYNDLLKLCNGNSELCEALFYILDWCCPQTILKDWKIIEDKEE